MRSSMLRGKIVEHDMTVGEFCNKINFVRSTFDRKLAGTSEFTRDEIERIIQALNLSPEDTHNIFFTNEVT